MEDKSNLVECPICGKGFAPGSTVENHVSKCLFLKDDEYSTKSQPSLNRFFKRSSESPKTNAKKPKPDCSIFVSPQNKILPSTSNNGHQEEDATSRNKSVSELFKLLAKQI